MNSRPRIAYVCADAGIPPDGHKGASVHFRELAAAFARSGRALDVVMAQAGDVRGLAPHRAECVPAPRAAGVAGELLQLANNGPLLQALQRTGPHAAVYERLSLFGLAGLAHARALGVPFVVEANAPIWREAAAFRNLRLPHAAHGVCRDVLLAADHVLAVSPALAAEIVAEGARPERVQVFGNGADLARFRSAVPSEKPPALRGRPTLLFAGSLKPWHGIGFLLRAFATLRRGLDCGLWIVGDGPARAEIERAIAAHPGDIVLEGAIAHQRMPGVLAAADIVVAPYTGDAPHWFSPLKVVEALAAGRPLVASRVPCVLQSLVGHEPPGLHDADDVDGFVAAVRRVLALGVAAGRSGIDAGLVQRLDWRVHAERIGELVGVAPGVATEVGCG